MQGRPAVLIGSCLDPAEQPRRVIRQMIEAVGLMLDRRNWQAAGYSVGLAINQWSASDQRIVAVLGPFRSAATADLLVDLDMAGLAVVSASNTYVPLTAPAPSYEPEEPECYARTGRRTFVRLFPNDYHQAAAMTQLAAELGCQKFVVLHDDQVYGLAIAEGVRRAAVAAGAEVAAYGHWHSTISASGMGVEPDCLLLCGAYSLNSAPALREHIHSLGAAHVIAGDAFLSPRVAPLADGMFALAPGLRPGLLAPRAESFVDALATRLGISRGEVEPYALHAVEAVSLILRAIGSSDGTRTGVLRSLFEAHVEEPEGLLGAYQVEPSGDIASRDAALGFTVFRAVHNGFEVHRGIVPSSDLVRAAYA